jgi:hypothetical protein
MILSTLLGDKKVLRLRKRPKETSSKAKTSREPFKSDVIKELLIPIVIDGYNYHMGAIDEFDYIIA